MELPGYCGRWGTQGGYTREPGGELGLPLEGEIFGAFGPRVFEGVGVAGGEEDEISVGSRVVFAVNIFLHVTSAHEDDLFGTVDVGRVADLARVERGGVKVDLREPGSGLAEDLAGFPFGGVLDGHGGPGEGKEGLIVIGGVGFVPGSEPKPV
jgi:hypothetical protein